MVELLSRPGGQRSPVTVSGTGDLEGETEGEALGLPLGEMLGLPDGEILGEMVGAFDGCDGETDGEALGLPLGLILGEALGLTLGDRLGEGVGFGKPRQHLNWRPPLPGKSKSRKWLLLQPNSWKYCFSICSSTIRMVPGQNLRQ